ncbi:MAG TPA: hypothetical protein VGI16_16260 [Candidatus Acidoferrum sp.]|jgi:hypothetical protein
MSVTANPIGATNTANNFGRCQACGSTRQTAPVKFQRNIGMLVARQTKSIQGNMCKTCAKKYFWDFTGKNLLLGPWGAISLLVTPVYLVTNIVSYTQAMRTLQGAVE